MTTADVAPAAATQPALQRLERRVVPYWYLTDVTSSVVFCAMLWFATTLVQEHAEDWYALARTVALVLGGTSLGWNLVAPGLNYARWRYGIDDELLVMRYGILFHEERVIPIRRMQHVDLLRGPIERLFGLATLVVYTAGNEGSAFRVPGLAAATAQQMRDRILKARGDDVL